MEINIKEMSVILNRLGELVEDYELNHLSYYNELNTTDSIWNSTNNEMLINEVNNQKSQINLFIDFLKGYILIFYRLVNELSYYGDHVKFNLNKKDKVFDKINEIINIYDEIIKIYEVIEFSETSLTEQKAFVKEMFDEMLEIKEFINDFYTKISDMNILTKTKFDELEHVIIKEEDLI